jgi:hypothetical protein
MGMDGSIVSEPVQEQTVIECSRSLEDQLLLEVFSLLGQISFSQTKFNCVLCTHGSHIHQLERPGMKGTLILGVILAILSHSQCKCPLLCLFDVSTLAFATVFVKGL